MHMQRIKEFLPGVQNNVIIENIMKCAKNKV